MTTISGGITITPLLNARDFLDYALEEAESKLEKAGAIQAFEFCYELSWKMIKRVLAYRGVEVASPREAFREGAQSKIIDDPEQWFMFLSQRNLTSHVYNEATAEKIFALLPEFLGALNALIDNLINLDDAAS